MFINVLMWAPDIKNERLAFKIRLKQLSSLIKSRLPISSHKKNVLLLHKKTTTNDRDILSTDI